MVTPLDKARELILKQSTPEDAKKKIELLKNISEEELQEALIQYFDTAEPLAYSGNVQAISTMLRVLEHFGDKSHDRMLLHYIAQAAANNALSELKSESHPHHVNMVTALTLISEAFADADQINDSKTS